MTDKVTGGWRKLLSSEYNWNSEVKMDDIDVIACRKEFLVSSFQIHTNWSQEGVQNGTQGRKILVIRTTVKREAVVITTPCSITIWSRT
jgi:hypothetical protein